MDRETLTLTIHGLPAFNKDVDGEVFARKFFKFMQALAVSDEAVNGGRRLKYLIEKLEKNTATAAVREQVALGLQSPNSGIEFFQAAANLIYLNSPKARDLPVKLIRYVEEIASGAGDTFQFGEIKAANDNTVHVDRSLYLNAQLVIADIKRIQLGKIKPFSGLANISLDGVIVTLEGRGEGDKAVIKLTAGGKEVGCLLHRISDYEMRRLWKTRCIVTGVGHYSGNSALPDIVDAVSITPVAQPGDWTKWRGMLSPMNPDVVDWN